MAFHKIIGGGDDLAVFHVTKRESGGTGYPAKDRTDGCRGVKGNCFGIGGGKVGNGDETIL